MKIKKIFFIFTAIVFLGVIIYIFLYSKNKNIDKTATQNIETTQKISGFKNLSPNNIYNPTITKNNQIATIDKNTSNLILVTKDEQKNISQQPVDSFSFTSPFLSYVNTNLDTVYTYNTALNVKNTFALKSFSPIISTSISNDGKTLYFLGNYNPENTQATLYSMRQDNSSPIKLISGRYSSINALTNSKLLLFEFADAPGYSNISVYSLSNNSFDKTIKGDFFAISPNKDKVLIQNTTSINIYNVPQNTLNTSYVQNNVFSVWNGDDVIIIRNRPFGVDMATLDFQKNHTGEYTTINSLNQTTIREVIGIIDNTIVAIDAKGNLIQAPLK